MVLLSGVLAGCASSGPAPVGDRSVADLPSLGYHEVRRGETLYSIAWRYGRDWRELARRNRLDAPYTIFPGDRIYLSGTPPRRTATTASAPARSTAEPAPSRPAPAAPRAAEASLDWDWPVNGDVVRGFSASGAAMNKGLDIRAPKGAVLQASAPGEVVYAGSGLRGFGELVIVKHDEVWLSAYAHNSPTLVSEGQQVALGERIAVLDGEGDHNRIIHFEIRRQGSPIDPTTVLPQR